MPSSRVEWFLAAKRTIRVHRDWDDQRVAEHCGIPRAEIDAVVRPARVEVEQDEPARAEVRQDE
jgi:hypothetical protein